jgi:cytosine/adenosine deaminase-related metal-dependent hydrolase
MRAIYVLALTFLLSVSAQSESGTLLVKNGLIFTEKVGETVPAIGYFLVGADGKILQVGPGNPPTRVTATQVVDATGKFISPGFISAHSHIYQGAMRGLGVDQTLVGWIDAISKQDEWQKAEDRFYTTEHGCFDFLRHGLTASFNFNDADGRPGINQKGFEGALASGMRFVHGYCLPFKGTRESRRKDFTDFYSFTRAYVKEPTFLSVALGGYSCFADTKDYAMDEGEIMKEYHLINEAHYLEPPEPKWVNLQRSKFDWYVDSGELGPNLFFGHFIHASEEILRKAAKAGVGMSWNPLSNGRLASGLADIPHYRELGLRIGMGVDGQASADLADPFENMRAGLYMIRAHYKNAAILMPAEVLRFHTLGSAQIMGVADRIGSLEPGKFADFLIIDPKVMDIGPINDPYAALVLACGNPNLEQVYVGGKLVVDHGKSLHPDFAKVQEETHRRMIALKERIASVPKK